MADDKTIISLCSALAKVGIWLRLEEDDSLIAGPNRLVAKHRDLITEVKQYKHAIIQLIKSQHAHALFGEADDDPRFASDTCPKCHQRVYVMSPTDGDNASTRRLSVHRVVDGKSVCPGGGLASTVEVPEMLNAFLQNCAIDRLGALLSWTSLWSAFRAWAYERQMLPLPAPETLQEAMSQRFEAITNPNGLAWGGVALCQQQWLGDKDDEAATKEKPPKQETRDRKQNNQQVLFQG